MREKESARAVIEVLKNKLMFKTNFNNNPRIIVVQKLYSYF